MTVRDELLARLHEELGDINEWLKAYEEGLATGRKHQGIWKDTSAMDKESYERLKKNIHDSIQRIKAQKKGG